MSATVLSSNNHKKGHYPFWKSKKFKNKKKKHGPTLVKNEFIPSDEDREIAKGNLLNGKRLSFLAQSNCNELVRDLMKNPYLSSPDRLMLIEHLAKTSHKVFSQVDKISLIKYSYEVHFFRKKEMNQVGAVLAKLQISRNKSAISVLDARLSAFKVNREIFDSKIYDQATSAINQIKNSGIFADQLSGLKSEYTFWKISQSFVYSKLHNQKTFGKNKHQNEITYTRIKPVIKVREWPELEQEFGISIRSNPFEYVEVLKLRVENFGDPQAVVEFLRKVNLLTTNFEMYLKSARKILEKAAADAEKARELAHLLEVERVNRALKAEQAHRVRMAEIAANQAAYLKKAIVIESRLTGVNDRTHRDRTVDGARENWKKFCSHCGYYFDFYSNCDCRY